MGRSAAKKSRDDGRRGTSKGWKSSSKEMNALMVRLAGGVNRAAGRANGFLRSVVLEQVCEAQDAKRRR
jgi:hypothetical protein